MSRATISLLIALTVVPAMAVAEMPPDFTVMFDADSRTLNRAGHQIVDRAAHRFLAPGAGMSTIRRHTRVELRGYTDATTSPEYALALSMAMVQAVADALVRDGVPREVLMVRAFGSAEAASDGDTARCRRVEIIFQ